MRVLCIIPARSGSKRLPNKAILPFAGTTLLEITCGQAIRLWGKDVFSDVIFSTDNAQYRAEAFRCGVFNQRCRPPELATDDAESIDVVRDALEWMENKKSVRYDTIVLLQVTSPLRLDDDIVEVINEYYPSYLKRDSSVLVTTTSEVKFPVKSIGDGFEDYAELGFQLNGAVYVWSRSGLLDHPLTLALKFAHMDNRRSIDIDTEFDFKIAEFIYEKGLHLL
jgi:CMP-N-acetylneuraminic acid synthetase